VGNRAAGSIFPLLAAAFRERVGQPIDFQTVGKIAGTTTATARRAYYSGWPATTTRGPLPPIRDSLRAASLSAHAAEPEPSAPELPVDSQPAPAPESPPPPQSVGPQAAGAIPEPAVLTPPPTRTSIQALVVTSDQAHQEEARVVATVRNAVHGVASISTSLLSGLVPLAAAAKLQLQLAAESGNADPRFVADLLGRLSDTLGKSASALAKLVAAESTLTGRPTQRVEINRTEPPQERRTPEEAAAHTRAVLAEFTRWQRDNPPEVGDAT
jgi:hypothetical protein